METKSANPNVAVDPETGMVWDVSDPSHPVRILPMDTKPVSSDVDLWLGMKNKVTPPTNQELGINPNMRLSTPYGVARPKTTDIPLWQKGAQLAINEPLVQMIPPKGFENNEWIQRIGEMASIVPNLAANIYKKPASAAILPAKLIESGMQGLSVSDKAFAQAVTEPFRGQKTYGQWSAENPLGSFGLEFASPIGWIMPGGKIKKGANIVEDVTKLLEKGTARDLIKKVLIETEQAGRKFSESEAENLLKTAEAKVGNIPNVTGAIPPRTPPPVPPIQIGRAHV